MLPLFSAVGSMVLYMPVFAVLPRGNLGAARLSDIAVQAVMQGALTVIIPLLHYG